MINCYQIVIHSCETYKKIYSIFKNRHKNSKKIKRYKSKRNSKIKLTFLYSSMYGTINVVLLKYNYLGDSWEKMESTP